MISRLRAELERTPLAAQPLAHGLASYQLGMALAERPDGERRANLMEAVAHFARALTVYTAAHPRERARVLTGLGSAERALGMSTVARGRFEEAVALLTTVHDAEADLAAALNNLGLTYGDLGEYDRARRVFDRALSILDPVSQQRVRATTLHNLGLVLFASGTAEDLEGAVDAQEQAVEAAQLSESSYVWASAHHALGVALMALPRKRREHLARARKAFGESLRVFRRTEFPFQHAVAKNNLGLAYLEDPERGVTDLRKAVAAFEDALAVFDPRLHRQLWKESRANLEKAMRALAELGQTMEPEQHFARLLAALQGAERERMMKERFRRLLHSPEPARSRLVGRLDRALVQLDSPALEDLTLIWMKVLMEQPHQQVLIALDARARNISELDPTRRHRASWALERAIGDLEVIQRVRIRELLTDLGFERPETR